MWLVIIIIAVLVLIVLGLGVSGTFDAIQKGWDKVPAQNITDNFREAIVKSANDISNTVEP